MKIGKNYLIRTVTHIDMGKLKKETKEAYIITNASWIADTGRWTDMLEEGIEKQDNLEIEPFPPKDEVIVMKGGVIDAVEYKHKLPTKQK
jgi:hypothetical protein